jgi:hypothetical protein
MKEVPQLQAGIILLLLALALIGGGYYATHARDGAASPEEEVTYVERDEARAEIEALLAEHPSEEAHRLFKERYRTVSYNFQHVAAHFFGELLYKKEGIPGIAVCDSDFGFGCYHSFFGLAIAERGPGVAKELDEECFKKYGRLGTGCPHGIGHGLMWYLGDEKLVEALSFCDGMHYTEPIGGCTSGVFMEYNEHTMATASGAGSSRPLDPDNAHAPCNSVPVKYRQACYFEQAGWWHRAFSLDTPRAWALCEEVSDRDEREACFRGLGNTIGPSTEYDPKASRAQCDLLRTSEGRDLCKQGAAWTFLSDPERAERAPEVCDQEDEALKRQCLEHAYIIK